MGVDTKENNVFKVAELIGYKTFINEFYAGLYKQQRESHVVREFAYDR